MVRLPLLLPLVCLKLLSIQLARLLLILDLDPDDGSTSWANLTISTTLLYYKTQSVSHTTGSIFQSSMA